MYVKTVRSLLAEYFDSKRSVDGSGSEEPLSRKDLLPHDRDLFEKLGETGCLAPDWERESGGLGFGWWEAALLSEELALSGVSDAVFINSVRNSGELIRRWGNVDQRRRYLPRLAGMDLVCAILYSEPTAGSDLGALSTSATERDGEWVLNGVKRYAVKADFADVAICAARTGEAGIAGITLFITPLDQADVSVRQIPSFNAEPFWELRLNDVVVGDEDRLGGVDEGWLVLSAGLTYERSGLDYASKARLWLSRLRENTATAPVAAGRCVGSAEYTTEVCAGRSLAWMALQSLDADTDSYAECAVSKLCNSIIAQRVASLWLDERWSECVARTPGSASLAGVAALREAPGLTLSAGSSEMMLEIIAADLGLG